MKHLFAALFTVFSLYSLAVPYVTLRPGLECAIDEYSYELDFVMPKFEIMTDTVFYGEEGTNEVYFSKLSFGDEDEFDYMETEGKPALPFYSVELMLPSNASHFEVTDYQIIDSIVIKLPLEYLPAQQRPLFDVDFSYDHVYYSTYDNTWNHDSCSIATSNYRDYLGFTFSLFPCHYEPLTQRLVVVTRATCRISFDGMGINNYISNYLNETDRLAFNYYDNFVTYPYSVNPPIIHRDHYLIISADEWIEDYALRDFVEHKESMGYDVTLLSLHDIGGNLPALIRDTIQQRYRNQRTKYVLLVGNVPDLPFYDGVQETMSDPPSDIYYSCLSKSNISDQWKDFNPTVFIGRWPVQNPDQLHNVVAKTINSDLYLNLHNPRKIGLFSGKGKYQNYMHADCKYIFNNLIQPGIYYTGDLIDGRTLYSSSFNIMRNYLEDTTDPVWLFVYDGHGNSTSIGSPYNLSHTNIGTIDTYHLNFQSFGFGFACLLGNIYHDDNFSRSWLTTDKGGVTYFGATTNTTLTSDRYFSRKLFNQLKDKPIMTIGELVGNAKAKYYNPDKVVWRRREAKKYVLYGDPSLYLFGLNLQYNQPYNIQKRLQQGDEEFVGDIISVNIYSITGQLLRACDDNKPNLQGLPAGTYMVTYKSENDNHTTQKIILQ